MNLEDLSFDILDLAEQFANKIEKHRKLIDFDKKIELHDLLNRLLRDYLIIWIKNLCINMGNNQIFIENKEEIIEFVLSFFKDILDLLDIPELSGPGLGVQMIFKDIGIPCIFPKEYFEFLKNKQINHILESGLGFWSNILVFLDFEITHKLSADMLIISDNPEKLKNFSGKYLTIIGEYKISGKKWRLEQIFFSSYNSLIFFLERKISKAKKRHIRKKKLRLYND